MSTPILAFLLALAAGSLAAFAVLFRRNRALSDRLEARARFYAMRDPLTELPTRALLHSQLAQVVAHADRIRRVVAVLFIDLDRFKAVNETFGHAMGDEVLKETARRLQRCVRGDEVVARIASDEFVIALADLERSEQAITMARKVLGDLCLPFEVGGRQVYCTASIGIAVHPGDGTTATTLIQNADIAMYRAKKSGRNTFQFFLPEMHHRAVRRLEIETALRCALEREEFLVHYQPKVDLRTSRIVGFEALLRWRHPQFGVLSPAEFVPILEDTNLIAPVGEWVLREACAQVGRWAAMGLAPRPVAVNISARQFRGRNLDRVVTRVVEEAGIDPALLELELTESLLMEDPEETVRTLRALKDFGVRLSVDDFGTGYSSLASLRRFPIDALKIDRAFVKEMDRDATSRTIIDTIIGLAHTMKARVIAEGVETAQQAARLARVGCDYLQGYHFSRPVPAQQIPVFVERYEAREPTRAVAG